LPPIICLRSYQQTIQDSNCFISDVIKIYFEDVIGYYWIFPRNSEKKEINIGVGTFGTQNHNLKQKLESFKESHGINGKVNYVVGGLIPIGIQRPLRYKNILFVGDAGAGTFPTLGKGIYRALFSGDIAGKCIAIGHPEKYPKLVISAFIKWDVIGKYLLRSDRLFSLISEKALYFNRIHFLNFWYSIRKHLTTPSSTTTFKT